MTWKTVRIIGGSVAGHLTTIADADARRASAHQSGPSGATLEVDTGAGAASLHQTSATGVRFRLTQVIPGQGRRTSVDVRIVANTGTVAFNGFYFVARSADGATVALLSARCARALPPVNCRQTRSVEATAFDRAPGTAVTGVVLRDPAGEQVAFWSVAETHWHAEQFSASRTQPPRR